MEHERYEDAFRHPDAIDYRRAESDEPVEGGQPQRAMPRPPRRGWRMFRRFLVFLLTVAILGMLAYGAFLVSIVAKISTNPWQFGPVASDGHGRTNVLVMGVGDPGHAGEQLSDSLMLVSLDRASNRVAQVSIPRDLRVEIEGKGYSKINAANVYGGVELAEQTVSNTLGVPVEYYVKTNFSGLAQLVDAVGGLDVDVKTRLADSEYPCDDNQYRSCGLVIEPGLQHMDGAAVLKYVRCRKGTCGNDFGRAERQQEVVGLLRPKLADVNLLFNPAKLKLVAAAVQSGVSTDMGVWQMLALANQWRNGADNRPVRLVLSTAPDGLLRSDPRGSSDLLPVGGDFSAISQRVQNIFTASE